MKLGIKCLNSTCVPSAICTNEHMQLLEYYPVLVQVCLAGGIGVIVLVASHVFGQRAPSNSIKDAPYECGMLAEGSGHARFAVKFYVTAMLFILFDIEVVFLIPWVLVFREFLAEGIPILLPTFFFLFVLVFGLLYELKKKAIDWDQ